jgi:hypothetical protein
MSDENDNENYYLDFYISGVVKVNVKNKKEKIAKIQKLINEVIEDYNLDLLKSESSLTVLSESEVIQNLIFSENEEDEFN